MHSVPSNRHLNLSGLKPLKMKMMMKMMKMMMRVKMKKTTVIPIAMTWKMMMTILMSRFIPNIPSTVMVVVHTISSPSLSQQLDFL